MADLVSLIAAEVGDHVFDGCDYCSCGSRFDHWTEGVASVHTQYSLHVAGVVADRLNEQPSLEPLPEPVMAKFDRLPLPMQMRVAANVMDEVNRIHRERAPMAGNSRNEPISASSMRYLADFWEHEMVRKAERTARG